MAEECRHLAPFDVLETDADGLTGLLPAVLAGEAPALLVKDYLDADACRRITENFHTSPGRYVRTDGVPAIMVGSNGFLKSADGIHDEYTRNNGYGELLFRGTRNPHRRFFDAIEDAGFRFRVAYADGVPTATHRAVMWDDARATGLVLKAHTDWPQVTNSQLEYADVAHPIGVSMYVAHPPRGGSWVRLYDFVPSREWLQSRGIEAGGFPIEERDLVGRPYLDILTEQGCLLLITAARVHAVHVARDVGATQRLNINGFIGYSPSAGRVLAWA